jgi:hypothetical protein
MIGVGTAEALASASFAAGLRQLGLSLGNHFPRSDRVGIGDAGVRVLATTPSLAGLRSLDLTQNNITDTGARILIESPHLRNLGFLNLKYNSIGKEMQSALRKHYGTGVCTFSQK